MIHLRAARKGEREQMPLHFEGLPLAARFRRVAWPLAVLMVVCGVTVMVLRLGFFIEIPAAMVAATGAVTVVGLVRCRRFEIVVGEKWLVASSGPFKHHVPRHLIEAATVRPSRSWRRLYAEREVVLRVPVGDGEDPVPSSEPEELLAVLGFDRGDGLEPV